MGPAKKSRQRPRAVSRRCWRHWGIGGSVQVVRRRLRRHAEYLARSGQASRLLHATRGQRQTSLTLNIGGGALAPPAATGKLLSKHPQINETPPPPYPRARSPPRKGTNKDTVPIRWGPQPT